MHWMEFRGTTNGQCAFLVTRTYVATVRSELDVAWQCDVVLVKEKPLRRPVPQVFLSASMRGGMENTA